MVLQPHRTLVWLASRLASVTPPNPTALRSTDHPPGNFRRWQVRVWAIDPTGRSTGTELKGHQDSVDQLRWDPKQPEVLGTASGDKTVRIWDTRSGKCANAIETKGETHV